MKFNVQKKEILLFQNGAVGDFLMFVWLAEQLYVSGHFSKIVLAVPRNIDFFSGFLGEYPYIHLAKVSRLSWFWSVRRSFVTRVPTVAIILPTIGNIPLSVKLLAWVATRKRGSALVGFQDKSFVCRFLYTKTLIYNTVQLYSDTVRDIVRACDVQPSMASPQLNIHTTVNMLEMYGLVAQKYIVFHPGTSRSNRALAAEDVEECISFVHKECPDLSVVLSGGEDERAYITNIASRCKKDVVVLIGQDASTLSTILKHARLYVGMDTGISHLACFLNVQAVVVAHVGTAANWLPFYAPKTTVLYQFKEDSEAYEGSVYLKQHLRGRLRPFRAVSAKAIQYSIAEALKNCVKI